MKFVWSVSAASVATRAARKAVTAHREKIQIPASKQPKFSAGKGLKEAVNGK